MKARTTNSSLADSRAWEQALQSLQRNLAQLDSKD